MGYLKRPLSDRDQVDLVYQNLAPDYRRYRKDIKLKDLEDIKHFGRKWEGQEMLDNRYTASPPKDKCLFPLVAFVGPKGKIAATEEVADVEGNKTKEDKKKNKQGA